MRLFFRSSLLCLMSVLSLASSTVATATPAMASPTAAVEFPLSTRDQWIVDALGQRVKLKSVNWYGASDAFNVVGGLDQNTVKNIVQLILDLGFNSVRLPFSNAMLHAGPVPLAHLAANPELAGKLPLEVYDTVVAELTARGLMVILNNHTTSNVWCCGYDENALWFNQSYSAENWMRDWENLAVRYAHNPLVIGADLRNEIRWGQAGSPNWGNGDQFDWRLAAQTLGNRLLSITPNWLIIVEGLSYAADLTGVRHNPLTLHQPNKVVYSSHSYSWFHDGDHEKVTYESVRDGLEHSWGYINTPAEGIMSPVWVGEFGAGPNDNHAWFTHYVRYLKEKDFDWCIWPLNNGPKANGPIEEWGLLTPDWKQPLNDWRVQLLRTIQ